MSRHSAEDGLRMKMCEGRAQRRDSALDGAIEEHVGK